MTSRTVSRGRVDVVLVPGGTEALIMSIATMKIDPTVSVVIPTHNAAPLLRCCLRSVYAQQDAPSFEVLVIDDASTDETAHMVQTEYPAVRYLRREHNSGPGATRNTGWRAARGAIIAFVDHDVIVDNRWLAHAMPYFDEPQVIGVEGRTEVSDQEKITPFTHWTKNLAGGEYPFCNIFLRRSALESVGGFDERFYDARRRVHFREDIELAFRLLDRGGRIPFGPDVLAYHPPLPGRFSRPLKLAQRYYFDPLLQRLHPRRFAQSIERHRVGPLVLGRPRHYASMINVLSALAIVILPAHRSHLLRTFAGLLWLLSYAFGPLSAIRHNSPRRLSPHDAIMAAIVFIPVPWVYVWSYLRGLVAFRAISSDNRITASTTGGSLESTG